MAIRAPRCSHCRRPMPGSDGSRLYCSDACRNAAANGTGSQNEANLDAILKLWRERGEGEPTYVDHYRERQTPTGRVDTGRVVSSDPVPYYLTASGPKRGYIPGDGPPQFIKLDRPPQRGEPIRWRDGTAEAHQRAALPVVALPRVGDESATPCPHCEGPMFVVGVIQDSVTVECPTCSGKRRKP